MLRVQWWVGQEAALRDALAAEGVAAERVSIITEASLATDDVERWCGIEPPPAGSRVFTLHPPIGAPGSPTWRRFDPGFAPDCELVAARVAP